MAAALAKYSDFVTFGEFICEGKKAQLMHEHCYHVIIVCIIPLNIICIYEIPEQ